VTDLNLEQLRKRAKERVRIRRAAGEQIRLTDAQFELAREHGFPSWPKLKAYVERASAERPFRADIEYYEERATGIASVNGVSVAEARRDLACRHGFASWVALRRHVEALRDGTEPPDPFMLAFRAVEAGDRERLRELLDRYPELIRARGTNGNDLLGMAASCGPGRALLPLLLEHGADPNRGNDYGWTALHQAAYGGDTELARVLLAAGADTSLSARGDGGTPLVVALFWGNRVVVDLLGLEPRNLRVAAGLGRLDLIRELAGTPEAGKHRGFYRPHGGFPAWTPSDDPQEVLDEALVWAAKSDRVEVLPVLVEMGARIDADPYRGTPLIWAAAMGRVAAIRRLLELGADPNAMGTFGGRDHGEGVTALHLAAQNGHLEVVRALLEVGGDVTIRDALHDGPAWRWAEHGGHHEVAELLRG
jgi:ankyrin repeat protein